jgi:hypothetical protein
LSGQRSEAVPKPPKSTPHSDIDGVHQDEKPNTQTAQETGQTGADIELARDQSKGRPPHGDENGRGRRR